MLTKSGEVFRAYCRKLLLVLFKLAFSLVYPVVCWYGLPGRAEGATVGQAPNTSNDGRAKNDVSQPSPSASLHLQPVPKSVFPEAPLSSRRHPSSVIHRRLEVPGQVACTSYTSCGGRNPDHVSRAAVSLAWLRQFVAKHRVAERNLTTEELTKQVVMPLTKDRQCRFTQLLLDDPDQAQYVSRGRPFYFISHAWSRPFMETLAMVECHFAPDNQEIWRRSADGQQALPVLDAANVFVW
ncbi:hypothetical protein PLESTF_000903400, partial [Pleodorina starrii]